MTGAALMLIAWAIEIAIGWPSAVFQRIRHPVVWIGAGITALDRSLNRATLPPLWRYLNGVVATVIVVGGVALIAIAISGALPNTLWGYACEALIASSLIASRSLYAHVADVWTALSADNLSGARTAVSKIVGRNPDQMDESALTRASLESLAENATDGVIAPIFWGVIFGLPGIAAYKAVNTLDSMIGHRNSNYASFGGFAARLDDLANFIPARLTGGLFSAASFQMSALRTMFRDASQHRSPNAGWPEAALAGALDVRLSGPRIYGCDSHDEPWLNQNGGEAVAADLGRGLSLYCRALAWGGVALIAVSMGSYFAT